MTDFFSLVDNSYISQSSVNTRFYFFNQRIFSKCVEVYMTQNRENNVRCRTTFPNRQFSGPSSFP